MAYVLDVWHARVEFPALKRAVAEQYLKWRPDEIVIEDKASGQSLIQEMRDEVALPDTWQATRMLPIVPNNPGSNDKVERVNTITPYVEGGRVLLPAPRGPEGVQPPWVDGFLGRPGPSRSVPTMTGWTPSRSASSGRSPASRRWLSWTPTGSASTTYRVPRMGGTRHEPEGAIDVDDHRRHRRLEVLRPG
jgi:hypothetical protein